MDFFIYISDFDTYDLIYVNKFGRRILNTPKGVTNYGKCYKVLQNQEGVCEFCNNQHLEKGKRDTWRHHNKLLAKHYMIKDHLVEVDGRRLRIECAMDISEMETDIVRTRARLETERNLLACIQKLSSGDRLEESMDQVLQSILDYYLGARAYIFEFDWNKKLTSNTYEKCAEGISAEKDNLQNLSLSIVDIWIEAFEKQQYIYIKDVNELKDEPNRHREYETLIAQNIKSLLVVPFYYNGVLMGFLGVDDPRAEHDDVQFLRSLSYFISNEIEKQHMNERLKYLSYSDQLTKVNNRNFYYEFLQENEGRTLENVGVLFLDLNGLKVINDSYGHLHGDSAIKMTGAIIKKYFDPLEIFRISGDEFVVIMTNSEYSVFASKVRELQDEVMAPSEEIASVGYVWESYVDDLSQMINRAEQLMYINKQKFYERNKQMQTKLRPRILDNLVEEMERETFLVYLQPKVNLNDNQVYGAEALVRRRDSEGRIVMPYEFISLLERERLIDKIDYFVLEQVCQCLKSWSEKGLKEIKVSVNISRVTLSDSNFVNNVCNICNTYGVQRNQIEFEITESAETMDENRLEDIIGELAKCGFGIALDDMGTQYSSLELLCMNGIDTIKLDRSLICNIEKEAKAKTLVRNVIGLCHDLGQICVAEGVENEVQKEILTQIGCDNIQGYLIERPIPIEEFAMKYL